MRFIAIALVFMGVGLADAQTIPAPVRMDEVKIVLFRSESALRKALKMPPTKLVPGAKKTATRKEIIAEFQRVIEEFRPHFRMTPRPQRISASAIEKANDKATSDLIKKLAAGRFIGPVGPLATGPKDSLTLLQFGDEVGLLFSQISFLTHQQNPRWSPSLMRPTD